MNQTKLYSPDKGKERRERFAAYARQARPEDYESEITPKDGGGVPVRISGVPTILHGRRLIIEFLRDMTVHGMQEQERDNQPPRKKTP